MDFFTFLFIFVNLGVAYGISNLMDLLLRGQQFPDFLVDIIFFFFFNARDRERKKLHGLYIMAVLLSETLRFPCSVLNVNQKFYVIVSKNYLQINIIGAIFQTDLLIVNLLGHFFFLFTSCFLDILFLQYKLFTFVQSVCYYLKVVQMFFSLLGIILLNTVHKLHVWAFSILSQLAIYQDLAFSIFQLSLMIFLREKYM